MTEPENLVDLDDVEPDGRTWVCAFAQCAEPLADDDLARMLGMCQSHTAYAATILAETRRADPGRKAERKRQTQAAYQERRRLRDRQHREANAMQHNGTNEDGELLLTWWGARITLAAFRGDNAAATQVLREIAEQDAAVPLLGHLATLNARAAVQLAGDERAEADLQEIVGRLAAEVSARAAG